MNQSQNQDQDKDRYRTTDLPLASFLHARGYPMDDVRRIKVDGGKYKAQFWFSERRVVRRAILEYGNQRDLKIHNVNAQQYQKSLDYLRSLARNF